MLIRNDDVARCTDLKQFEIFCNICDKHGFKIIQCITPVGNVQFIDSKMTNEEIIEKAGNELFIENKAVYDYLKSRNDLISIHGLYHTHRPTLTELTYAKKYLEEWGFEPRYNTYPFNELSFDHDVLNLITLPKSQRIEDYHRDAIPTDDICYLHFWRYFHPKWYTIDMLDRTLGRIANARG